MYVGGGAHSHPVMLRRPVMCVWGGAHSHPVKLRRPVMGGSRMGGGPRGKGDGGRPQREGGGLMGF